MPGVQCRLRHRRAPHDARRHPNTRAGASAPGGVSPAIRTPAPRGRGGASPRSRTGANPGRPLRLFKNRSFDQGPAPASPTSKLPRIQGTRQAAAGPARDWAFARPDPGTGFGAAAFLFCCCFWAAAAFAWWYLTREQPSSSQQTANSRVIDPGYPNLEQEGGLQAGRHADGADRHDPAR